MKKLLIAIILSLCLVTSAYGAITIGSGTPANVPYIFTYDASASTYSSNLSGTAAHDYFPDTIGAGDIIYFGGAYPFRYINFYIGTAVSATDLVLVWEYRRYENGAYSWVDVTSQIVDGTAGFTNTGACTVDFIDAHVWNTYSTTINSVSQDYWCRVRVVSVTASTEGGANSTTAISEEYLLAYLSDTEFTSSSPATWETVYTACVAAGMTSCYKYTPRATENYNKFYIIPIPLCSLHNTGGSGAYLADKNCKVITGNGTRRGNFFNTNGSYRFNLVCGELSNGYGANGCQIINQVNNTVYNASDYGSGSRLYKTLYIHTPFINPDTGNSGMSGGGNGNLNSSMYSYDTEVNATWYGFTGNWIRCIFRNSTLLLGSTLNVFGCDFVALGTAPNYWFTGYYTSLIFDSNYFQAPTAGLIQMYGAPSNNLHFCFRDPRFDFPTDPTVTYKAIAGAGSYNPRAHADWIVGFRIVDKDTLNPIPGAKVSAVQKDATTGLESMATFIRYGTTNTTLADTLTSNSSGYLYSGAYTGVIRGVNVYYDATNTAGYPTDASLFVYQDLRETTFIVQAEGYRTEHKPVMLNSKDEAGNYIRLNGDIKMEHSAYANR